jgi:hypothetical protein
MEFRMLKERRVRHFNTLTRKEFQSMYRLMTFLAVAALFTGLAVADTWNGKLLDAACVEQEKGAKPCDATSSTAAFILDANGKQYKLDAAGSAKVAAALKSRADRSAPGKPAEASVNAKITGKMEGDSITVETVEVP